MLSEQLVTPVNLLIVAVLLFNLTQRSHQQEGEKKRFATLYIAGAILLFRAELALLIRNNLPDSLLVPALLPPALLLYFLRAEVFLFRRSCRQCGARLPLKQILYRDEARCDTCREQAEAAAPEEQPAGSAADTGTADSSDGAAAGGAEVQSAAQTPQSVDEVDWNSWNAQETAVLCYVFQNGKVLLIHKKTGLGKGKINAPGGRMEAGESPEETVVRELQEEVRITPTQIYRAGELSFIFTDGYSLHGHVYFAEGYQGTPEATDEADPFWVPVEEIPYGEMWEDDELWLPLALAGSFVTCRFIFDGDRMLSKRIETASRPH
jgi:8-oxo-dGTP diphosphatase